ncbi:MAG TPA: YraN family protein [Treponemataceae bacterium]|nr:YraN family protein [Treponemataceae bacterium]
MQRNKGSKTRKKIGDKGEDKAVKYLEQKEYSVVCRNYRKNTGEIDIIASKADTLVFVEVKTAPHGTLKTLEHLLGIEKQKRIVETAKCFLLSYRQYSNSYIRFDVLVIDMPCYPEVYHIENAFSEFV